MSQREVRTAKRVTGARCVGRATEYRRQLRLDEKGQRCCTDCGLTLSRYNPDARCGPCAYGKR